MGMYPDIPDENVFKNASHLYPYLWDLSVMLDLGTGILKQKEYSWGKYEFN